ncbi:MAG: CsgG/HfaB family protein, partial [Verrucomicrobiae bacterium]|nr:CsgG/HfaB family protein [Verrucomicrobiae bacterium]
MPTLKPIAVLGLALFVPTTVLTAADPAPAEKTRLAVLDLSTGEGLKPDDGQTLAMFLRAAIVQTGRFEVMERQQIKQLLDEQKFQEAVCDNTKCMVKAGKILAVERVMGGRVAKLGTVWTVVLNLVDVESAKLVSSYALPFDGPVETLL